MTGISFAIHQSRVGWKQKLEQRLKPYAIRAINLVAWMFCWSFHLDLPHLKPASQPQTDATGFTVALSEISDTELVRLCLARGEKDDRPFRELFHRYQKAVWYTCYSFFRNNEDAEDFTQEAFFNAYRSLAQFEGRSSFKTWVHRIAVNVCQNELRRRSRRPHESTGSSVEELTEILPAAETPESYFTSLTRQEYLKQALATLRPDEYQVLQLKDLEQRSYKEIMKTLDISLSAAKMRVQRARLALMITYNNLANKQKS